MKKRLIELKENAVMMVECATMANEKMHAKIEDADDSGYFLSSSSRKRGEVQWIAWFRLSVRAEP